MEQQSAAAWARTFCWEKFLHMKTISVLLLETDDSTRRTVTDLLRRFMYQVIPVENGQQAWKYLQDPQTNIDLVLTNIVHGVSRIIAHSVCNNIPVVVMASKVSMSTIFQCVSMGTADFLIKPLRPNELITLWQHVWRRCQSASGSCSGSRRDIQTHKFTESKSGDESNNNSGSNGDTGMGLNARDGTQAQSSWTKRAVEIDSSQDMSPDQSADPADSTCAHVIHPNSEIWVNKLLPGANNEKCKKEETNDEFKRKELAIGAPTNLNTDDQSSPNGGSPPRKKSKGTIMEILEKPLVRTADLIGSMAKNMDARQAARAKDSLHCSSKVPEGKETDCDGVMPSLELSLKRPRTTGDAKDAIQEEQRNDFRRLDLWTFARYNTCVVSNEGGAGFAGSCSPYGNSSEAAKMDCTYSNMKSGSDAGLMEQGSNGSSKNKDMGSTSTTKNVTTWLSPINGETHISPFRTYSNMKSGSDAGLTKQGSNGGSKNNDMGSTTKNVTTWLSPINGETHISAFRTYSNMKSGSDAGLTKQCSNGSSKNNDMGSTTKNVTTWLSPINGETHISAFRRVQQCTSVAARKNKADEMGRKNTAGGEDKAGEAESKHRRAVHVENGGSAGVPQSNVTEPSAPVEVRAANYGSHSGSNNNTSNESNAGTTAAAANVETGGVDKRSVMCLKRELRVAARDRFRQKRKELDFGKKVRYQSRKRGAEQRPRVRGQFVRHLPPSMAPVER